MLIGLDGGTWKNLRKWIDENKLPTLKKIVYEFGFGNLISTIPSYTSPALPTLFTGKNPANTGIFGFFHSDGSPVSLQSINDLKIWNILDLYNKKSCIVNVRMTYPPDKLNGVMISGNPAPSEESDYVFPAELKERVKGFRHDYFNNLSAELTNDPQKNKEKILNCRIIMTQHKYKIFKELNLQEKYDFSFFWIGGTDFIQHYFWDDEETMLKYFIEVDKILKDIIETFTNKDIIIISDHGFSSVPRNRLHLNTWLEDEGYLYLDGNFLLNWLKKLILPSLRHIISSKLKRKIQDILKSKNNTDKVDILIRKNNIVSSIKYSKIHGINFMLSKAYLVNNWGIKVQNYESKDEYERLRNDIIKGLLNLKDKKNKALIKYAWRKEEVFKGKYLDQLPDIVFLTNDNYSVDPLPSIKYVTKIHKEAHKYKKGKKRYFRGDHDKAIEGIITAIGPNIQKKFKIEKAYLQDIMPTILHLLNLEIPTDIDGRVIKDIFSKESTAFKRKPKFRDYKNVTTSTKDISKEEEEEIVNSLKLMGYM